MTSMNDQFHRNHSNLQCRSQQKRDEWFRSITAVDKTLYQIAVSKAVAEMGASIAACRKAIIPPVVSVFGFTVMDSTSLKVVSPILQLQRP